MSHFRGLSLQNITLITEITFQVFARRLDVRRSFRGSSQKKRNRKNPLRCTAIDTHAFEHHLLFISVSSTRSISHSRFGGPLFVNLLRLFINLNSSISPRIDFFRVAFSTYPITSSIESFMQRNDILLIKKAEPAPKQFKLRRFKIGDSRNPQTTVERVCNF